MSDQEKKLSVVAKKPEKPQEKKEEKQEAKKPETAKAVPQQSVKVKQLINKIADVTKELKDAYAELPDNEKNVKANWRPLQKGITLLFIEFEKTFYLEEKVKNEEFKLEMQKRQARQKVVSELQNAKAAQESLK